VADTFGSEINVGPPPATLRKRRPLGAIGILALLLLIGVAGGVLWFNLDGITDMLHGAAGPASSSGSNSEVLASAPEPTVSAADFSAFQQQTGGSIRCLTMLVSSLSTRIEQMQQGRAAIAPTAAASVPVAPIAAAPVAAAPRSVPAAPRKRAPVDRPAGAISVGGAPLQTAPAR
jgi:hypothetical protein